MRLAILKKNITGKIPEGVVVFLNDLSFKDNEYNINVLFLLEKNDFDNNEDLLSNLNFVVQNPNYKRTKSQLEKRNSDLIGRLEFNKLEIDWSDGFSDYVNFRIKEYKGLEQKFSIKKKKNIYYTLHLFYDIIDAKLDYLEKIR